MSLAEKGHGIDCASIEWGWDGPEGDSGSPCDCWKSLVEPPIDDEREALAWVIERGWGNPTWDGKTLRPIDRQIADAVLAAGFRRQGPVTDAKVEAAAIALHERIYPNFDWATTGATTQQNYRGDARVALEAARATPA